MAEIENVDDGIECPDCDGSGYIVCERCDGSGLVDEEEGDR